MSRENTGTSPRDCRDRVCVIGAGPCGLTACKNLADYAIPFDCYERQFDLGGNWLYGSPHSSVFGSTHLISSRQLTQFVGFRMPHDLPDYPHHAEVLRYLRSYAEHFRLCDSIKFNTSVDFIRRHEAGYEVQLSDGQSVSYGSIIIANGHHWHPRIPDYAGEYTGKLLHAKQYKTPAAIKNARLLIVGGGNSACDIAVEAVQHAAQVTLSLRRGYHVLPKYLFGIPTDQCGYSISRWKLPKSLARVYSRWLIRVAMGPPQYYGLPAPDHDVFAAHPIVNSKLPLLVAEHRIKVRPDVDCWDGTHVRFRDGRRESFDVVILATGYEIQFPFVKDPSLLHMQSGVPDLFLHAFHPGNESVFVSGLFQPNGGIWRLADLQMQLAARFLRAERDRADVAGWFRRQKRRGPTSLTNRHRYLSSPRHAIEVDYAAFRRSLEKWVRKFDRRWQPHGQRN